MNTRHLNAANGPMIESLEDRTFLSAGPLAEAPGVLAAPLAAQFAPAKPLAAAASYNLMDLNGFNRRGALWTYNATYKTVGSDGKHSGSGSGVTSVSKKTARYDNRLCNVVNATAGENKATIAWYSDRTGTSIMAVAMKAGLGTITLRLHDTRVAPSVMTIGKTYSDTGSFDGTFSVSDGGITATGTINGSAQASSTLVGTQQIRVPAGRFSAVKGTYTVQMSGRMTLRYEGKTYNAQFSATVGQAFWAVPGTGVVKGISTQTTKITVPNEGSETVTGTATCELTSYK